MKRRLIWQILPSFMAVIVFTVTATVWYANRTAHELLVSQTRRQLQTAAVAGIEHAKTLLAAGDLPALQAWTQDLADRTSLRLTVITPDGTVVADSEAPPAQMENHFDRPEVQQALRTGTGQRTRRSSTVNKAMMYLAVTIPGDSTPVAVLRTSSPVGSLEAVRARAARGIIIAGMLSIFVGSAASFWITRRVTTPVRDLQTAANRLANGDFKARLRLPESRELAALASSFNNMASQLAERIDLVTQQKNEAQAILGSMVEGVLAIDQQQNVININDAAGRMLGLDPNLVSGRSIQEVIRNPGLFEIVTRTLASPLPVERDVILRNDTAETHLQVHGTRLPNLGGPDRTGAVLVLNDVTRLRRLELVRKEFAANVSHELRTPITSITGFVETLLDGAIDDKEDAVRFLEIIRQHAERLNALIADLLSLAGIEKDVESEGVALVATELAPELQQAAATCRTRAAEKNITLRVQCPQHLQASINGNLFAQALVNLIDNAVKYSPPNTEVRIVAEQDTAEGDVNVQVVDQGRGIAHEHLERLFERFYRVDKARNRDDGGTGLGLAIVKHVVQAHKGRVEVDSTPGQGSTFIVRLPAPETKTRRS